MAEYFRDSLEKNKLCMVSEHIVKRFALQIQLSMIVFIFLSAGFLGCRPKEPLMSEAAYAFKKEMGETLRRLSPLFIEPVAKRNVNAINATLEKIFSDAARQGRPLTFAIVVLDQNGVTLTCRYPKKPCAWTSALNYANYSVVAQALKERRILQGRFFLQDGTRLYVICAPLLQNKGVEGVLVLWISASQMNEKLGVSEREFLSLDFNK